MKRSYNDIVEMAIKLVHIKKKVWLFKKEVFQNDNLLEKTVTFDTKITYLKMEGIINHSEQ